MGYCIRCKERWTGLNRSHCTACHKTFNSVSAFDAHQSKGKCRDPEEMGMKPNDKGIWSKPMLERDKKQLGYA